MLDDELTVWAARIIAVMAERGITLPTQAAADLGGRVSVAVLDRDGVAAEIVEAQGLKRSAWSRADLTPMSRSNQLASDLAVLFTEVGLESPRPVPVRRADHQVAQKLHAACETGSERARDFVDLQLLDRSEELDLARVASSCARLFEYRRQQEWPPSIVLGTSGTRSTPKLPTAWTCGCSLVHD